MRFLLFLPGFFFLVLSWLLTIREASRSSRKSGRQKSSAQKPPKATGTAAIEPIVIRDEPQQPKRKRGRPRKNPAQAPAARGQSARKEAPSARKAPEPVKAENHFNAPDCPTTQLAFAGFATDENAAPIQCLPDDEEPEPRIPVGQLGIYEIIY